MFTVLHTCRTAPYIYIYISIGYTCGMSYLKGPRAVLGVADTAVIVNCFSTVVRVQSGPEELDLALLLLEKKMNPR